MGNIFTII